MYIGHIYLYIYICRCICLYVCMCMYMCSIICLYTYVCCFCSYSLTYVFACFVCLLVCSCLLLPAGHTNMVPAVPQAPPSRDCNVPRRGLWGLGMAFGAEISIHHSLLRLNPWPLGHGQLPSKGRRRNVPSALFWVSGFGCWVCRVCWCRVSFSVGIESAEGCRNSPSRLRPDNIPFLEYPSWGLGFYKPKSGTRIKGNGMSAQEEHAAWPHGN